MKQRTLVKHRSRARLARTLVCMDRATALAALVRMEGPVSEAAARLQAFPWDSESDLVVIKAQDFARVLRRYCLGEIAVGEIENWANALECREDLGFGSATLRELLHEMPNPLLTQSLSQSRAKYWLAKLGHAN